jgi:ankyrin repeat protein
VRLLLAAGADPNSRDVEGNTCLHKAAFVGNYDAILRLVEAKAEIDATDAEGGRALSCLYPGGPVARAKLIIRLFLFGPFTRLRAAYTGTPLHNAIYNGHYDCVCLLLQLGAGTSS